MIYKHKTATTSLSFLLTSLFFLVSCQKQADVHILKAPLISPICIFNRKPNTSNFDKMIFTVVVQNKGTATSEPGRLRATPDYSLLTIPPVHCNTPLADFNFPALEPGKEWAAKDCSAESCEAIDPSRLIDGAKIRFQLFKLDGVTPYPSSDGDVTIGMIK